MSIKFNVCLNNGNEAFGTAYDLRHRELPPEQVPTQEISMQDGDGDLPF